MKTIIALLFALSTPSFGATVGSPYMPELDSRLNNIETLADGKIDVGNSSNVRTAVTPSGDILFTNAGVTSFKSQAADGLHAQRVARATLNCAASGCSVGAHGLGVSLPAKALITRSYINVVTQFTDTGTCTVAISCEDANNIKTATDITGTAANGWIEGQSTGAASTFIGSIAAACEITATVADGGSCVPTAGKAIVFVEYNVVE